jgi:hypothetical protein
MKKVESVQIRDNERQHAGQGRWNGAELDGIPLGFGWRVSNEQPTSAVAMMTQ